MKCIDVTVLSVLGLSDLGILIWIKHLADIKRPFTLKEANLYIFVNLFTVCFVTAESCLFPEQVMENIKCVTFNTVYIIDVALDIR